ncbi:MAG TPA: hypothetical protein VFW73_02530 [Lacipirellulaceae bacterium]|nr:hypothetical protein [Lacipirellulaceae bacterium]
MTKLFVGTGVALDSVLSSLSYLSSHGTTWLPLLIGLVATMPAVGGWAVKFAYGEAPHGPTLWHIRHGEHVNNFDHRSQPKSA